MPVKFPTTKSFFPSLELSDAECQRYDHLAQSLVEQAIAEYDEYNNSRYRENSQPDPKRWKEIKRREKMTVYKEKTPAKGRSKIVDDSAVEVGGALRPLTAPAILQQRSPFRPSTATFAKSTEWRIPNLLVVGSMVGTLDDVMYGIAAFDASSTLLRGSYTSDELVDAEVLYEIHGPSVEDPYRFLGLKWIVKAHATGLNSIVWPRDLVYMASTGVLTTPNGTRLGYQLMHSVDLPTCGDLMQHNVVRATVSSCVIFQQLSNGIVDVFMKSQVEPNGSVMERLAIISSVNSLFYCSKAVLSAQHRKLEWRLHQGAEKAVDHSAVLAMCGICDKAASRFSQLFPCDLCRVEMCSRCRMTRKVHYEVSVKVIDYRLVILCKQCMAHTNQLNALEIAREEVASGRWSHCTHPSWKKSKEARAAASVKKKHDVHPPAPVIRPTLLLSADELHREWKARRTNSIDRRTSILTASSPEDAEEVLSSIDSEELNDDVVDEQMQHNLRMSDADVQDAEPRLSQQQQMILQIAELQREADSVYQYTLRSTKAHVGRSSC